MLTLACIVQRIGLLLLCLSAATCSRTPSRADIEGMLSRHPELATTQRMEVPVFTRCRYVWQQRPMDHFCGPGIGGELSRLCSAIARPQSLGLVDSTLARVGDNVALQSECSESMRRDPAIGNPQATPTHYLWRVTVTEKAVALGVPKTGGALVMTSGNEVRVTGVAENADGTLLAQFEATPTPTDLAMKLNIVPTEKRVGGALLRKFDDGWRVASLDGR